MIVDDHALFRAGVRAELDGLVDVLGDAATVEEAVRLMLEAEPDVVLLDVQMPGGGGVEVIRQVARRRPGQRFLALSVSDAAEDVIAIIRAGARGYVTKTISGSRAGRRGAPGRRGGRGVLPPPRRLRARRVRGRGGAPPAEVDPELDQLTPREREVLRHIARGYLYKEIALRLGISARPSRRTCPPCCASCSSPTATSSAAGRWSGGSSSRPTSSGPSRPRTSFVVGGVVKRALTTKSWPSIGAIVVGTSKSRSVTPR